MMSQDALLDRLSRDGCITIQKFDPAQNQLWAALEALAAAGLVDEDHAGPSTVSYFLPERDKTPVSQQCN